MEQRLQDDKEEAIRLKALKKQDFNKWYEEQKCDDWRHQYLKYGALKNKIETTYLELFNYFSKKSKGGSVKIPKGDKLVKENLMKFEQSIIDDLGRVAGFYHQEEVKVLSLTYDLINELKSLTVKDFSKVLNIVNQLENCVREVMDLIYYIQLNTQALKHLLKKFDEVFGTLQDPIFKQFFVNNYKDPECPLRVLLEHQGIVRCYFQLKYITNVIEDKLERIYDLYKISKEHKRLDYCIDMEEFPDIQVDANHVTNLHKVRL